MWHEAGAGAANSGVQFTAIGQGGLLHRRRSSAPPASPAGHIVLPATGLVAIENTHNLGGGVVFPQTRRGRNLRRRARAPGSPPISTAPACSTPRSPRASASPSWRGRSISSRWPCRRGSAARSAACWPAARPRSPARCAPAACSAARCGNPASSPPPGSTRSTITSRSSPRTTPMRALHRRAARRAPGRRARPRHGARPTSSSSASCPSLPDAAAIAARAREAGVLRLGARPAHGARGDAPRCQRRDCERAADLLAAVIERG